MHQLTIIIPIYNGADHLKNLNLLLDAIDKKLVHVIVIDDASTDGSFNSLKKIQSKHDNLIIKRNKTNKGIGFTRNKGIHSTQTPYVCFLDIDDKFLLHLNHDIFRKLKILNSDFYIFNYTFKSFSSEMKIDYEPLNNVNLKNYPKLANVFPSWSAIYSMKFIRANKIKFKAKLYEDFDFTLHAVLEAKKISIFNDNIVEYNKNNTQSVTAFKDRNHLYYFLNHIVRVNKLISNKSRIISRSLIINRLSYYFSFLVNNFASKVVFDRKNTELLNTVRSIYKKHNMSIEELAGEEKIGILYDSEKNILGYYYFLFMQHNIKEFIDMLPWNKSLTINDYYSIKSQQPFLFLYLNDKLDNGEAKILHKARFVINFNRIESVSIHVGYTKTGTSFIQQNLLNSYDDLIKNGVLYPKSLLSFDTTEHDDTYNSDHNIFASYFKDRDLDPLMIMNFQDELNNHKSVKHLIISAENIIEFNEHSLNQLIDFFSDLKINMFLSTRDLLSWIDSSYKEKIKSSEYYLSMNNYLQSCILKNVLPMEKKITSLKQLSKKRGCVFNLFHFDASDEYFENLTSALASGQKITMNTQSARRASSDYSLADYINMRNFNYFYRKMRYESFVKIKREYLKSISVENSSDGDLDYTFISKNLPNKLYSQIGIKSKSYFDAYFTAKKYVKPSLMSPKFFNKQDLHKEKAITNRSGFMRMLVKKLIVIIIKIILGNYRTRKFLYKYYPYVSSFSVTKRIINIYKNNIS